MKTRATLSSKGRPGWTIALKENSLEAYTIGRHPSCSLVLTDMHISSKHLSLLCDGREEKLVITDTSSNGTWFDGQKLEKNVPLDVMYEERGIHEIVFPCDDPKKNDYTFVLTVGADLNDGKATAKHPFDSLRRETSADVSSSQNSMVQFWDDELVKLQDELINSSCRVAAAAFALDSEVEAQDDARSSRNNDSAVALSAASKAILALKETNVNCLLIAKELLHALKDVQSKVALSQSIDEEERQNLLERMPVAVYEEVLEEAFKQADPSGAMLGRAPTMPGG